MKTTFEELLGKGNKVNGEIVYPKSHVLTLLKLVREKTLEECVYNAQADVDWTGYSATAIIDEDSILGLSKDSIEI